MSVSAARAMFEQGGGEAPPPRAAPGAPPKPAGGGAGGAAGAAVSVHTLSLDDNTKRPRPVSCMAVNGDGTLFAYSPNNHEVYVAEYTGSGFNTISVLKEHDQLVTSIDWAQNSDRFVTCSQDRNAYVWDGDRASGWKPTLVHLRIHKAATYVKWSHNQKKFAVASGQKSVAVCYYEEENNWWVSKLIEGFESTVLTVAWHNSDIVLAAGSSDGTVRLFAAAVKGVDSKPSQIFGPDVSFKKMGAEILKVSANAWVHDMSFSPTSDVLAYTTHDSCVSFLPIVEGAAPSVQSIQKVKYSGLPFRRLLFVSSEMLLAGGYDGTLCVLIRKRREWFEDTTIDKRIFRADKHCITDIVTCSSWRGVEAYKRVASVGYSGKVRFWAFDDDHSITTSGGRRRKERERRKRKEREISTKKLSDKMLRGGDIWLEEVKREREACQKAERQDAERRRHDSSLRAIVAIAAWIVAIVSTLIWPEEFCARRSAVLREVCQEAERQDAESRTYDSFLRAIAAVAAWTVAIFSTYLASTKKVPAQKRKGYLRQMQLPDRSSESSPVVNATRGVRTPRPYMARHRPHMSRHAEGDDVTA